MVYAKKPFAGPAQVLTYLARYTHRVAIANSRLVSLADGRVSFRWKDYRHQQRSKVMTLDAGEFIRRFLMHTLPSGFHRIRHYGVFANTGRAKNIELCRALFAIPVASSSEGGEAIGTDEPTAVEPPACPHCGGRMIVIESFTAHREPKFVLRQAIGFDTS